MNTQLRTAVPSEVTASEQKDRGSIPCTSRGSIFLPSHSPFAHDQMSTRLFNDSILLLSTRVLTSSSLLETNHYLRQPSLGLTCVYIFFCYNHPKDFALILVPNTSLRIPI